MQQRQLLTDLSFDELGAWLTGLGQPAFRAKQLFSWLYGSLVADWGAMTNLPADLRERLSQTALLTSLALLERVTSADGLTTKDLLELRDGETIESVLMRYEGRQSVCLSSQVGCAVGCPFCATGQSGLVRNLTSGEIVDQVLHFARQLHGEGAAITNVVFMGMGEPLANYDPVWKAIRTLNDPRSLRLGARRFTVSTVGIVPGIRRMMQEGLEVGLAVSLHAPTDDLRSQLVPVNKTYPLAELISVCREYAEQTHRRVTFEYALIQGVNDSPQLARQLGQLLHGMLCHVNLIPVNPTSANSYRPASRDTVLLFRQELNQHGIANTVRLGRGLDIQAGCGQLRSRHLSR
ncbi:MAG TPA: 23S rRNA (adenine(2503)-C(2))-methyltransferase RlmN [Anaerolineae bacterium]|nr:23S rRNA (adenine(2503)-C(2))-methyltransferase RlmN [Anaerolineae bacterium]HQJ50387.1 23S rRNA (adenine(2503)-C(2))-methyltransferase RlmN [Anaerolineae bacterium]